MGIGGYLVDYIFGNNNENGNYNVSAVGANNTSVLKAVLSSADTVYNIFCHLNDPYTGVAVKAVIYDDNAGYPDNLLVVGNEVNTLIEGWNVLPLSSSIYLTAGTYWIGLISDTHLDSCNASYSYQSGIIIADTYADGPADPFVSGGIFTSYGRPFYAASALTPILESGKVTAYTVIEPPEGIVAAKVLGYTVTEPPDGMFIGKLMAYAVLQTPKTNTPQVSIIV